MSEEKPHAAAGADASAKTEKLTPAEWATRKGIAPAAKYPWEEPVSSDWRYSAAAELHGWSNEAYHYQAAPFRITEEDFDKALEAAAGYPAHLEHEPAVAPHAPFRKQFEAAKKAREAAAKQADEAKKVTR